MKVDPSNLFYSTQLLEYSLVVVSIISIGHISTTALQVAAISLGSMTANVSGYSVILGLTSALDTILPSTWTSNQPHLVGLWAQRMGQYITSLLIASCQLISYLPQSCRSLRVSCSKSAGQEHLPLTPSHSLCS